MKKDEFYIGWQDQAPASYASKMKRNVLLLTVLVIIVAVAYVFSQQGFNNGVSELGYFSQVEGTIEEYPVPMLRVKVENDEYQNFLLFGFGKSDAYKTINLLKEQAGGSLENQLVQLESELLYYDGKTVLEVPVAKNQMSVIQKLEEPRPERKVEALGSLKLKGEIVDSKCFFGLMKPGYGKIHRSCGVRCIDGGIPPVLVINNGEGERNYFILIGQDGQPVNQQVLDYVGLPVQVEGQAERVEDWMVLKINPQKIQEVAIKNFKSVYYTELGN